MCSNGVNINQFNLMLDQIDDHIKVERRWSHTLAHLVKDAGMEKTASKLHEVQHSLDDIRAMIDDIKEILEEEAEESNQENIAVY